MRGCVMEYTTEELIELVNTIVSTMEEDEPKYQIALIYAQQLQEALVDIREETY